VTGTLLSNECCRTYPSILAIAVASPITIFRKACELEKHKVVASGEVPKSEQNPLDIPQRKKLLYNRVEKEK
jgi:hypothetical protein